MDRVAAKHQLILVVFGSPYVLRDINIKNYPTILVAYENNELSMKATAKGLLGKTKIHGRLPVVVNQDLKEGEGIDVEAVNSGIECGTKVKN